MVIIQNIDNNTFLLNNRKYIKKYLVLRLGTTHVAIHNAFDVRLQLVPSTHFSQIQVNGATYNSQEALMNVLSPLLFSDGDVTEGITQNNKAIYLELGLISGSGDITTGEISSFINAQDWSFIVSETNTPTLIEGLRTIDGETKKYIFIFTEGKGNWGLSGGSNPHPVYPSFFKLLSVQNLTPDDIQDNENNQINYLGEIDDEDFVTVANETEWSFIDNATQYYFSFTKDDVLYFALFVGEPDVYGGGGLDTNDFSESDFVITTNSGVQPTTLPTGLEAINEGNGIGWRLVGRNPNSYGNIGQDAVDFSFNQFGGAPIASAGATGTGSLAFGRYTISSGFGSFAGGNGCRSEADFTFTFGDRNQTSTYGEVLLGTGAEIISGNSSYSTNDYSFRVGIGLASSTRKDGFRVHRNGLVYAPNASTSLISSGDGKTLITKEFLQAFSGSSGTGTWGSIAGALSAQTDLQTALNAKGNVTGGNTWIGNQIFSVSTSGSVLTVNNITPGLTGNIALFQASGTNVVTINKSGRITASSATTANEVVVLSQLDKYLYLNPNSPSLVKSPWYGTKAQYDALGSYDPTIEYNIETNEFRGNVSVSANGTTTISIPHGLGNVPSWLTVDAKNLNAAGIQYKLADSSNIKIFYSSAPTGTLEYWVGYNS